MPFYLVVPTGFVQRVLQEFEVAVFDSVDVEPDVGVELQLNHAIFSVVGFQFVD